MNPQLFQQAVLGLLALVCLGGSMVLYVLKGGIPEWLTVIDGAVAAYFFSHGSFLAQQESSKANQNALLGLLQGTSLTPTAHESPTPPSE